MTDRVPRVLHVIETLDIGGAEAVLIDLVAATRHGCEPMVCCLKHRGELADRLDPGIRVICLGARRGLEAPVAWRLASVIRRHRIDVVHSHLWGTFLDSALAARLVGVPVIHTVHGTYPQYGQTPMARAKRALRHTLERFVSGWHRRIVTVSTSIEDYARAEMRLDPARLETVQNGIGARAVGAARRTGNVFITVGRMAKVKNQSLMLRAFSRVVATAPSARLLMVGDGPERAGLEALAAGLGIAPQVQFLGFRRNVSELLDTADVFLMSSHYEGISIALLEAMRASLPVVATRVGGVPETLDEHCAVLVADDDEESFAAAMLDLLLDGTRRNALGRAAAFRQRERFSLEGTARRYLQFYSPGGQQAAG